VIDVIRLVDACIRPITWSICWARRSKAWLGRERAGPDVADVLPEERASFG